MIDRRAIPLNTLLGRHIMTLTEFLNNFDFENGDLDELESLLRKEFSNGDPIAHRRAMIDILDRLGDGYHLHGIDWSILHGLEYLEGHNEAVLENWEPTYWRLLMVRRIINSGVIEVCGINLNKLIEEKINPNQQ